ncbi:MAG: bifunctional oligoribonuclease/PAP phosphatase NrnA [Vicinamibacterales bacterium]
MSNPESPVFHEICRELQQGSRFLLTSHERPDGDSVGSQLALAFALDALGKHVEIINADPPPVPFRRFPGTDRIRVAREAHGTFDAVVVLECGDLARTGVRGLERYRVINIDHHIGNTEYGALNWFDAGAAACAELVVSLIDALGVPFSTGMATHVYLGILTDTGAFHHSHISARTFDICRRAVLAGVNPAGLAHDVYDTANIGRLKLLGHLLDHMRLEADGRLALLYFDDDLLQAVDATHDDTEGLINVPLTASTISTVALFKGQNGTGQLRVSLRSKGDIDVRSVALQFGGGGHFNAAGCSVPGPRAQAEAAVLAALLPRLRNGGS